MRRGKLKYGIQNWASREYLEQFRRFTKCKSLDEFLHLPHTKRNELVKNWLRVLSSSNTEVMILEKTVMIFTFLKKKKKLVKSTSDMIAIPRKRHPPKTPI